VDNASAGFRNLDLTEITREVLELFDPAAEENGVTLRLAAGDRAEVVGDRDLLFDAISNLVDNAIKHSGKGWRGYDRGLAQRRWTRPFGCRSWPWNSD
jgi:signal transduction histidine kinase